MSAADPAGGVPGLQIHPTAFCNLACAHCYTSSGPKARGELPLALLEGVIEDAAAEGYRDMAVSGGEPFLYSRLDGLLAAARAAGLRTAVTTNALVLPEGLWERAAPLIDLMAVSVDGRPEGHDRIRRRKGAFARTVANLARIRAAGIPFGLIFTLTQSNADEVEFVVALAAETGARFVQVHPLTLAGRAQAEMADERPDALERIAGLVEALRAGRAHGVPVQVDLVTAGQIARHRCAFVPPRQAGRLVEAAPTLIVTPQGAVVPMTHEIDPGLHLGRLQEARLPVLARRWLADGRAQVLAEAAAATWQELAAADPVQPFYWYDEVAARSARVWAAA